MANGTRSATSNGSWDDSTGKAHVSASLRPLSRWDTATRELAGPSGRVCLEVASYSGDPLRHQIEVRLR